jgi:hypothetical protein
MGDAGRCKGPFAIYDSLEQCTETCLQFPSDGKEGAVSGDSVQCRTEHAILAQGPEGPKKHCPHAAPGGGGVCIDRSPCQAYCLFYYDRVEEGECPAIAQWGGDEHIGRIDPETFVFEPNPKCMESCAKFAGSGAEWEMSGDSPNCRQQYYLMAHRRIADSPESKAQRFSLCRNAHAFESEMCQGYSFGDYYKTTAPDPCKELCYNDALTCGARWGSPEACRTACSQLPTGQRRATQGNSVQCRLTWAQYAFFVAPDHPLRTTLCELAQIDSLVCQEPGSDGAAKGATLPTAIQNALTHH